MVALVYGKEYERAHKALKEVIEIAELRPAYLEDECLAIALDFGLHPNDISHIFKLRVRFPDMKREGDGLAIWVQKILLLDGFYGDAARNRTRAHQVALYGAWQSE